MNRLNGQIRSSGQKQDRAWTLRVKLEQISILTARLTLLAGAFVTLSLPSPALPSAKSSSNAGKSGVSVSKCCAAKQKIAEASKSGSKSTSKKEPSTKESSDADKKKAEQTAGAGERKPVLEPSQFYGLASFGYASAKACPEVMEKLFCYCGCDLTDSHTSLLDCFTSIHGVDCHICQEEAVLANKMNKDGISIKEIQKKIDETYASQYPFESDTPTYKKYKTSRLWTQNDPGTEAAKFGTQQAGPDAPEEKSSTPPKLKPGREPSKCCSGGEHKSSDEDKSKEKNDKKTKKSKQASEKN